MSKVLAKRAFCTCMHSYWSHRWGFYDDYKRIDVSYPKARHICERVGCRCMEYTADAR